MAVRFNKDTKDRMLHRIAELILEEYSAREVFEQMAEEGYTAADGSELIPNVINGLIARESDTISDILKTMKKKPKQATESLL